MQGASSGPLGERAGYLLEQGTPQDLAAAQRALKQGAFQRQERTAAGFGIASPPVWMHLALVNPSDRPLTYQLLLGQPWLDQLDVRLVRAGQLKQHWRSGDMVPGAQFLLPAMGYVFPVELMPGRTELFVRAQTAESFLLPVSLLTAEDFERTSRGFRYRYGVFYGFLLAFIFYNLILFAGLWERSHLYYALYVLSFMALSLVYTGHGFRWWWSGQVGFQQYALFAAMVLYACAGLLFAVRFLQLDQLTPRVSMSIRRLSLLALAAMALFITARQLYAAVYLAYGLFTVFTLAMVVLGVFAYRRARSRGIYFLPAVLCSMLGLGIGLLTAFGLLASNVWTTSAVEIGLILEAVLLSLALGNHMRNQSRARQKAEHLARIDSLTGLLNRRAFLADAAPLWSTAVRHGRPMSVLLLDIDFFKQVNDQFGHDSGDRILQDMAKLLLGNCREGDILARWGGEEFVLLLPETGLGQATALGERIRRDVEGRRILADWLGMPLTVSLGAAQLQAENSLSDLVCAADGRLYEAKRGGRNQIVPPVLEPVSA
ncbi:diguanylate cyclase (GGDEF) domain-containing protein [Microbulbifer donghaiensis]|uniref:diguanylate cyclase n=1 Tax=Microbulbifer donghaiensis TaxID=494016 RepID=A0A1M4X7Q9_9GAMM|nr:diguanylate cyclase (GGDEF) domain-containing protein [Microbulbifer donghaiensis]